MNCKTVILLLLKGLCGSTSFICGQKLLHFHVEQPFDYLMCFLCVCMLCRHAANAPSAETIETAFQGQKKKNTTKKRESVSTVIITIDHYDFSDSSCCFRNVTVSPMRLVMSMVIILDVTAVSVTAKHGLHRVLLLFFPFFFSPCDVLYPT